MKLQIVDVQKWDAEEAGVDIVHEAWNPTPEEFAAYRERECQLASAERAKGTAYDDTLYHIFSWAGL